VNTEVAPMGGDEMTTTEANEDIWAGDTLDRKADADFVIRFLLGRIEQRGHQKLRRSYVLNVDAGWSGGKTFFMSRLAKELTQRGHGVALVDAWEDDHADDPLLSLMSAIEATINPLVKSHPAIDSTFKAVKRTGLNIAVTAAKGIIKQTGRKIMGEAAEAIANQIGVLADDFSEKGPQDLATSLDGTIDKSAEKLLEGFEEGEKSISQFRSQLGKLTTQIRAEKADWTLFVLIDELDRCRPTHAIVLLERVKHLFNVDNVVFVVATDTAQLSESVRAVYGAGFDGMRYLSRFFDRTYHFPETSFLQFLRTEIATREIDSLYLSLSPGINLDELCIAACNAFNAKPREIKHALDLLIDIAYAWSYQFSIEASIMIPFIFSFQTKAVDFIKSDPFLECSKKLNDKRYAIARFPNRTDGPRYDEKVLIGNLIAAFSQNMNNILTALESSHDTSSRRWIQGRMSEELTSRHNHGSKQKSIVRSVVAMYPSLILTAGRLKSLEY